MADIFLQQDLLALLKKKKVVFMGDSNVRSYYKDMLCLYTRSKIIGQNTLKNKMENSVFNDKLVFHSEKTNGRDYREERVFKDDNYHFEFYFLTRVYNDYMEDVIYKATRGGNPDVVIINSSLWDMARWGPKGVEEYKKNMVLLMERFNKVLKQDCLVIWVTTPPLSSEIRGGFLVVQLDFLQYCLRFHVMEANTYARRIVVKYGYDVLDIHYHLRMHIQYRCPDGIHWTPHGVRYITNLILTHISLAWGVPLPKRVESVVMKRALEASEADADVSMMETQEKKYEVQMSPRTPKSARNKKKKNRNSRGGKRVFEFQKQERLHQAQKKIRGWRYEEPESTYRNRSAASSSAMYRPEPYVFNVQPNQPLHPQIDFTSSGLPATFEFCNRRVF